MNKADLIARIAYEADIPTSDATRALNAIIATITNELSAGGEVALVNFGRFTLCERNWHRVWQNGSFAITPTPINLVRFTPGKQLKGSVNQRYIYKRRPSHFNIWY